ncbi:GNAT family N-acetyltransferase [Bradyrhizobium prioriisuperbiae]|uniref:GNAT family N-acetyltransferase n=1 Tax=Bradyrhizobium prioriisuperbiae TaxID=2854389 RepID=UPI0028EA9903|nr:GNAT family N-acetyltransferase [Bradyrhizobium prioritasuperba]
MDFSISDLRERPDFFDTVADRIWTAWWKRHGVSRDTIVARLRENLEPQPIPLALVAHEDDVFVGTVSLIASDIDERPNYTPWVAAAWVEPDHRGRRVGAALVGAAAAKGFELGWERLYLCAAEVRRSYYERLGWSPIEEGVGDLRLTVFSKAKDADPQ